MSAISASRDPRFCFDYSELDEYDTDSRAIAPRFGGARKALESKAGSQVCVSNKQPRKEKNAAPRLSSALRRAARRQQHDATHGKASPNSAPRAQSPTAATDSELSPLDNASVPSSSQLDSTGAVTAPQKQRMRTSEEVYNRVKWDSEIQAQYSRNDIMVGYLDRFDGMQETPFNKLRSWGDIYSDKYFVPFHRVWYFRCGEVIIWDREKRIDLVFGGSSTDSVTQTEADSARAAS